jgi:hypothetical protein
MNSPLFVTFLLSFIKELKNDSGLLVQITNTTVAMTENFKYGLDQLPKWKEDELRQLKESVTENHGHFIFKLFKDPRYNKSGFDYHKASQAVISAMVDIGSKKIQGEHPFSNKQLEQIIQKIKFYPIPKDLHPLTIYKEELVQDTHDGEAYISRHVATEKNTKERAIVRCRIPMRKVEEEFIEIDEATGDEVKRKVERQIEEEIEDKVQLIPSMVAGKDYTIYAFNQPAPRNYRREVYSLIRKHFADFFDGRDANSD